MTDKEMDWNMSDATMRRHDEILQQCHAARFTDNYQAWYKALDNLYVELQAICQTENISNVKSDIDEAKKQLRSLDPDYDKVYDKLQGAMETLLQGMKEEGLLVKQRESTTIAGEN